MGKNRIKNLQSNDFGNPKMQQLIIDRKGHLYIAKCNSENLAQEHADLSQELAKLKAEMAEFRDGFKPKWGA